MVLKVLVSSSLMWIWLRKDKVNRFSSFVPDCYSFYLNNVPGFLWGFFSSTWKVLPVLWLLTSIIWISLVFVNEIGNFLENFFSSSFHCARWCDFIAINLLNTSIPADQSCDWSDLTKEQGAHKFSHHMRALLAERILVSNIIVSLLCTSVICFTKGFVWFCIRTLS